MPNPENPVFVKTAILQVLQEGSGYGSQLLERIKKVTRGRFSLSTGAIYPVLRTMDDDGLIAKARSEGRTEVYKLTAKGKRVSMQNKKTVIALFGL